MKQTGSILLTAHVGTQLLGVSSAHGANLNRNGFSFLQGLTDAQTTQMSVVRSKANKIQYRYCEVDSKGRAIGTARAVTRHRVVQRKDSSFVVDKIVITGLQLSRHYRIDAVNSNDDLLDSRFFQALDLSRDELKFAQVSCMHDSLSKTQGPMWKSLVLEKPEMIFILGDSVYADTNGAADASRLWERFVESRMSLDIYFQRDLIPTLGTWDDHDYGSNNTGAWFSHKDDSLKNFQVFFAQEEGVSSHYERGPANASRFTACGQEFYLMDCRYFRSKKGAKNGQTHWGTKQEEWLYDNLASNKRPSYLMNGSQYFGGYLKKDSFEHCHPQNFTDVLSQLKKVKTPVVFCSGDIHYSELMRIEKAHLGYETIEIVSSGIHSHLIPFRDWIYRNPRRIAGANDYNFSIIDSRRRSRGLEVKVRALTQGGVELYRHEALV